MPRPLRVGTEGRFAYTRRVSRPALPLSASLLLVLLCLQIAGFSLAGPAATVMAVAAIALFGLPHGALDIEHAATGGRPRGRLLARYLAVAGLMAACWAAVPALGLLVFLGISTVHFSRDWRDGLPRAERVGLAGAVMAFTALGHAPEVSAIFTALAGPAGALATRVLRVASGPAAILAGLALVMLARSGRPTRAVEAGAALAATLFLPPVVGFALFFCAVHSPPHLAEARNTLPPRLRRHAPAIIVLVTALALGGGALLYTLLPPISPTDRLVSTTFLLLSVLTAPHLLLRKIAGRRP